MIKISVIMPVYNESLIELNNSISSILNQTYRYFEFIIIDDNPKSNHLKSYLKRWKRKDERIKLLFDKKNLGAMLAANQAIEYSAGEFIARMDADDIATPNRLKYQLNFCIKNNLSLSCSNYISFNRSYNKNDNSHDTIYPDITIINQSKIKNVMSYINIAIGPTLFFKKDLVNHIGKYRNMLCEDYDLVARALVYNYKVGYLCYPLIYKRDRLNNLSNYNGLKEYLICNIISKCLRNYKFTKILSLRYINEKIKSIKLRDKNNYYKFVIYSNRCKRKDSKSFMNCIKRYYYAFSSILMIKRSITTHFSKLLQNVILK